MNLLTTQNIWLIIGFAGQFIFGARFVIQWIASEKSKMSIIPEVFWYISMLGSLVLLAYAIYKKDPVFIAGQSLGMIIYVRNIVLINRNKAKQPS